jgi:hypothetical protein
MTKKLDEMSQFARSQSWYLGCNLLVVVQRLETFHSTGEHAIIRISPYLLDRSVTSK